MDFFPFPTKPTSRGYKMEPSLLPLLLRSATMPQYISSTPNFPKIRNHRRHAIVADSPTMELLRPIQTTVSFSTKQLTSPTFFLPILSTPVAPPQRPDSAITPCHRRLL